MSKPTVLILGAGANVGTALAKYFHAHDWLVATASRSPNPALQGIADLMLSADFSDAASLAPVFHATQSQLGVPVAVVYNAYALHPARRSNPLTLTPAELAQDTAVNVLSPYEAARLALELWQTAAPPALPPGVKTPAFIYTGNMQNTQLYPATHSLGLGKNASAYWLEVAAAAYKGRFRFYYGDERNEKGESVMAGIDGEAHATEYWELVHGKAEEGVQEGQGEWNWTFVKGKGYLRVNDFVNRELRAFAFPGLE